MWITRHFYENYIRFRFVIVYNVLFFGGQGQIAEEFNENGLEAILNAIPEDLPSQDLCPWFRTVFVPFVRRVLPKGQVEHFN